jgi:hypothetical protein
MPKSVTMARSAWPAPDGSVSRMLPGFRPPCGIPAAWAYARASATCSPLGQFRGERRARDEAHDDPRRVFVLDHVEDRDHAGVIEPGGRQGRAGHAGQQVGARGGRPRGKQDLLDRDLAVKDLVTGAPHPAGAALADGLGQQVPSRDKNPHPTRHSTIIGRVTGAKSAPGGPAARGATAGATGAGPPPFGITRHGGGADGGRRDRRVSDRARCYARDRRAPGAAWGAAVRSYCWVVSDGLCQKRSWRLLSEPKSSTK